MRSELKSIEQTITPLDTSNNQAASERKQLSSILIVDDEPGMCSFLKRALAKRYSLLETASNVEEAEALRQRCHFDLIITDIRLTDESGVDWVQELRDQGVGTPVIFMTAYANVDTAIAALRVGAIDFILKPFRTDQMLSAVERCLEQQKMLRENFVLRRQMDKLFTIDGMIGECETMRAVCEIIRRVAPMPSTVLIAGESGTGKELAARAIHKWSERSGSFVPINCGAISPDLLESELFGHTKGAFTGAHQAREGLFAYADSGTVFLDEIAELPLNMQAKLLRVLEEKAIRPVGANKEVPINVRIIAASNRDLQDEVNHGRFRQDLFYRLNVLRIELPALRDRHDDIKTLASYFVTTLSADLGLMPAPLTSVDIHALESYSWPGNVREFKNLVERSLLLGISPAECLNQNQGAISHKAQETVVTSEMTLRELEKTHILNVLEACDGNQSEAARRLGVARKTLGRKLQSWLSETHLSSR